VSLDELQRALGRVCLKRSVGDEDLARLGGRAERWMLYRTMVRSRLFDSVAGGMPRVRTTLGDERFRARFDAFLDERPPHTRLIRAVTSEFTRFLETLQSDDETPVDGVARDLARFEAARLDVLSEDAPDTSPLAPFSMEFPPTLTPAHRIVRTTYDVHLPTGHEGHAAGAWTLLVYRDEATQRAETLVLSETATELVEAMARGIDGTTACIREVIARHGGAPDAAFLESVAALLATLIERGVLLGVRPIDLVSHGVG
jgi:hypothetical protein